MQVLSCFLKLTTIYFTLPCSLGPVSGTDAHMTHGHKNVFMGSKLYSATVWSDHTLQNFKWEAEI